MSRNQLVVPLCALLLVAGGFSVVAGGCSKRASQDAGVSSASQVSSATTAASGTIEGTAAAGSGTATGTAPGSSGKRRGLSAGDAKAIDAELSAIEKELDGLSLPSDSDLTGIESGLK